MAWVLSLASMSPMGTLGLAVEDVVGPLALASAGQLAAHGDAALREADFLADLRHLVPPGLAQGRGDELGADVAFAETFLVHGGQSTTRAGVLSLFDHRPGQEPARWTSRGSLHTAARCIQVTDGMIWIEMDGRTDGDVRS